MGRFTVYQNFVSGSGDILDFSMQGEVEGGGISRVVQELIGARMAGKFQATANHPLVETFQPTKSTPAFEVNMGGVHHFLDRGIPAQPNAVHGNIENTHPPGGNDSNFEASIIQGEKFNAFLFSPAKGIPGDIPCGTELFACMTRRTGQDAFRWISDRDGSLGGNLDTFIHGTG